MFKSFEHFKKATHSLLDAFHSNPKIKLVELRTSLAKSAGFSSLQALSKSFENVDNVSQSAEQVFTVSFIHMRNGKVYNKVDFIDDEKGRKSVELLFLSSIKIDFNTTLGQEESDRIFNADELLENAFFELSDGYSVQIFYSKPMTHFYNICRDAQMNEMILNGSMPLIDVKPSEFDPIDLIGLPKLNGDKFVG